jgi:hypothetical protein
MGDEFAARRQTHYLRRDIPALGKPDVQIAPANIHCRHLSAKLTRRRCREPHVAVIALTHLSCLYRANQRLRLRHRD